MDEEHREEGQKNLAGLVVKNKKGEIDINKINKRGLANVRRGFCLWTKRCFNEVLYECLFYRPFADVLDLVNRQILVFYRDLFLFRI